jgi:hypothetical protein
MHLIKFAPEPSEEAGNWRDAVIGRNSVETAAVTIRGIELAKKIKKQQFNLKPLTGQATTAPELWAAVLVA